MVVKPSVSHTRSQLSQWRRQLLSRSTKRSWRISLQRLLLTRITFRTTLSSNLHVRPQSTQQLFSPNSSNAPPRWSFIVRARRIPRPLIQWSATPSRSSATLPLPRPSSPIKLRRPLRQRRPHRPPRLLPHPQPGTLRIAPSLPPQQQLFDHVPTHAALLAAPQQRAGHRSRRQTLA